MKLQISKEYAARSQLETAIDLFIDDCDPISIHSLAKNSVGILRDLNKANGRSDPLLDVIKPELRKEWLSVTEKPRNFFKHANVDPDGIQDFNSDLNTFAITNACILYQQHNGSITPTMNAWIAFFMHTKQWLITNDTLRNVTKSSCIKEEFLKNKKETFEDFKKFFKKNPNLNLLSGY